KPRKRGDDFFHNTIGEVVLLRITAQVLEWQHGDRGFVRKSKRRLFWAHSSVQACPIDPHRSSDVLHLLLTRKFKSNVNLALQMIVGCTRTSDPTRFSQFLQTSR